MKKTYKKPKSRAIEIDFSSLYAMSPLQFKDAEEATDYMEMESKGRDSGQSWSGLDDLFGN